VDFGATIRTTAVVGGQSGVRVDEVRAGSPANKAGLRPGDVLVAVDGQGIQTLADWYVGMLAHHAGESVRLRVVRSDEEPAELGVVLAKPPAPDGFELARKRLGLELEPVPANVLRELRMRRSLGLWVADVESGSPADRVGIRRGDILRQLGRQTVDSSEALGRVLQDASEGEALLIGVVRRDRNGPYLAHGRLVVR
jgi:serine protease Do